MLADLSTYSLQDFLLFDAAIYRDLFAQIDGRYWPIPVVGVAAALVLLALAARRHRVAAPGSLVLLAAAFATSAWLFFLDVYATINWAAVYPGWAFLAEAALLLMAAFILGNRPVPRRPHLSRWFGPGAVLVLYGLFGHPLAGFLFGHEPGGLEWFTLAPDPTAIVAIGLLAIVIRRRWLSVVLAALPLGWLLASAATLWLLVASGEALLLAALAMFGLVVLLLPNRRPAGTASDSPLPAIVPRDEIAPSQNVAATLVPTSPLGTGTRRD
ncbi:DUF6064 family protein [Aurantimonas sp. A2-1-M11]|uniref:DUF6064 family protein n=1 Tax=Aurantimonas sp. A2-1-M11 TaxID=3113712 RepID=UPI002F949B48